MTKNKNLNPTYVIKTNHVKKIASDAGIERMDKRIMPILDGILGDYLSRLFTLIHEAHPEQRIMPHHITSAFGLAALKMSPDNTDSERMVDELSLEDEKFINDDELLAIKSESELL